MISMKFLIFSSKGVQKKHKFSDFAPRPEILCLSLIPARLKQIFPIISLWELSASMATTILKQPIHNPIMLHIKFDQDWQTGLGDILVRKCEQRTLDDRQQAQPILYCPQKVEDIGRIKILKNDTYYEVQISSTHARRVHKP